jgi:hypothetical protein
LQIAIAMTESFSNISRQLSDSGDQSSNVVATKALEMLRQESNRELLQGVSAPKLAATSAEAAPIDQASKSYLQTWIDAGTSRVISDSDTRATVNRLAADFVKTASMFTGGKVGLAGTFLAYGLDQARPADSWGAQAADFALGGAKGEAMRGMFSVIGTSGAHAPLKGALMGLSAGACDEVFKRQTFTDPASLNDRLRKTAFNPQTVLLNAATFVAGEGLYSGIDLASKGALSQNRLLSGMVMGGSFGFVNGTVGEATRELSETGTIKPGKVLWNGLLDGSVSAAGAGVGIKISDPVFQQKVKDGTLSAIEKLGFGKGSAKGELKDSQMRLTTLVEDEDGAVKIQEPNDSRRRLTAADLVEAERKPSYPAEKQSARTADYGVEKGRVDDAVGDGFETAARQKRMQHLVDAFEKEATKRGFSDNDKALFYQQLNRLLADNPRALLNSSQRADLAEQVLNHSAFPTTVDQGKNSTCNVTTVEHRLYANDPDIMARMVADLAETGKFVTPEGRTIDLGASGSGIKPDLESARSLAQQRSTRPSDADASTNLDWASQSVKKDGGRDWASQLAQTTMVKIAWMDRDRVIFGNRILGDERMFFNKAHEMVMTTDPDAFQQIYDRNGKVIEGHTPPVVAYNEKHQKIANYDQSSLVYKPDGKIAGMVSPDRMEGLFDRSGSPLKTPLAGGQSGFDAAQTEIVYHSRPGELTYDKMIVGNDGKSPVRECVHLDRNGKTTVLGKENGETISSPVITATQLQDIHSEVTGRHDLPFVVIPGSKYGEYRNAFMVNTSADLARALETMQAADNLPGVIHVHTSNAPWSKKPGGGHVINLQGFDANAETVQVTNQWGSKEDAAHGNLPLDVMAAAMKNPPPAESVAKPATVTHLSLAAQLKAMFAPPAPAVPSLGQQLTALVPPRK